MLRRLFFGCCIWLAAFTLSAQGPPRTYLDVEIYRTRTDSLTAEQMLQPEYQHLFKPASEYGRSTAHDYYWIKVDLSSISEHLAAHEQWAIYFGTSAKATLFYPSNGQLGARNFGALNEDSGARYDLHLTFNTSELIDGTHLLVKYQKLTSTYNMGRYRVSVLTLDRLKSEQVDRDFIRLKNRTFTYIFLGIGGIVLLFALSAYITQRRREYLYYSLYLAALLLYFGRRAFVVQGFVIGGSPLLDYTMHLELQVMINLFYVLFARYFLNTKEVYPVLDQWIKWVAAALVLFVVADVILIQTGQFSIHYTAMNAQRYFMASFGMLGSIYLLVKRRSTLVYFIVFGSLSYTSGALATLFLVDNNYMMAGSAIEIFIFTLGLSYKSFALLKQNARIEQEVLQLEMKALRAQMNPHFIFNSLGSIQYLIRMDRQKKALKYLSDFSKLLRLVLESARQGTVTVAEEAELLAHYIGLEALRFQHQFTFEIDVDPQMDAENLEIPILLIQPHVENAIIHGLIPKEGDAHLIVSFREEEEYIRCQVVDNGIGRKASMKTKSEGAQKHKSRGLSIVEGRLDQLKPEGQQGLVQIRDIENPDGSPLGTSITIRIPKEDQ